ncbi:LysM peptidoglycan-binding domain-containing protein [Lactobacillus johnsonii]|uniref:LysM peptidoglycan-binding domain-containing protein n=1 Tax=Lactobacillus johnsonii TaxID=33959 RepID=UPI001C109ED9|nr:LysM domain-containing protein [Lactobacillus johnsonii]MBU5317967.1 LysM peptidoglycan-binding domain-containing protein [Lactobacillus johnsonii]
MKENKSQDNKEPKGPYKHFERPKTSRRAMHHRESEAEPEVTSRKSTQSEGSPKGPHHSQLWAGLIIVAIIIIALIPIVSSRLHANSNNLAEKSVKVSKSSSSKSHKTKSKKSKQSSSKKSKSKSSSVRREEESSSSQSQDTTPAVVSQSESQSSQVSQSSSAQSYESSASQTTTQDQSQQSTQTNQNTWQNNGGNSSSEHEAPRSYTVQEGDSLSKIARENNTSVHHLEQINDLESADSISIGQSIKLR